ncbi:hypothetical protein CYMTET_36627 [Cymbomonas tetramitiformis]|uniref:Uncharacterized protein n=1 Tax=Cymbomonas tetramitiformis TaxID=36881 RepID=A0AAE0F6T7_9CHLO|nr:hypothetical protein CYMTET_36627 [Cymbomonas tetramitiformis]
MESTWNPRRSNYFFSNRPRAAKPTKVQCKAVVEESTAGRRAALSFVGLSAAAAFASRTEAQPLLNGVCPLGEEGQSCRLEQLAKDDDGKGISYAGAADKQPAKPVAKAQDPKYEEQTLAVTALVREYMGLATFDKRRPELSELVKKEGNTWVSKYAPGGSSRKESARALYSALSSLLGQFAFNGIAPMKGALAAQVVANCDKTETFLAQGR